MAYKWGVGDVVYIDKIKRFFFKIATQKRRSLIEFSNLKRNRISWKTNLFPFLQHCTLLHRRHLCPSYVTLHLDLTTETGSFGVSLIGWVLLFLTLSPYFSVCSFFLLPGSSPVWSPVASPAPSGSGASISTGGTVSSTGRCSAWDNKSTKTQSRHNDYDYWVLIIIIIISVLVIWSSLYIVSDIQTKAYVFLTVLTKIWYHTKKKKKTNN